jgi:2-keto-3-deoxy-L-rhamnonate aldolase RhmA
VLDAGADAIIVAMIETAAARTDVSEICAVAGLSGIYVGPNDLSISMGVDATRATTDPAVREAVADILRAASAAGLVVGIHAGDGKVGQAMAQLGFQMITLTSESRALRRGAAEALKEGTAQDT